MSKKTISEVAVIYTPCEKDLETVSTITKRVCDHCHKETSDHYLEVGWIQIMGKSITISKGRKPDRTADSKFIQLRDQYGYEMDFCGMKCLSAFLEADRTVPTNKCPSCGKDVV